MNTCLVSLFRLPCSVSEKDTSSFFSSLSRRRLSSLVVSLIVPCHPPKERPSHFGDPLFPTKVRISEEGKKRCFKLWKESSNLSNFICNQPFIPFPLLLQSNDERRRARDGEAERRLQPEERKNGKPEKPEEREEPEEFKKIRKVRKIRKIGKTLKAKKDSNEFQGRADFLKA